MSKNSIIIIIGSAPDPNFSKIKFEDVSKVICSNYSAFNLPAELKNKPVEVFFGGNAVNNNHKNKLAFYNKLDIKNITILDHKTHYGLSSKRKIIRLIVGLKKTIFRSIEFKRTLVLLRDYLEVNTVRFIDRFLYFQLRRYILTSRLLSLTDRKFPSTGVFSVLDTILSQKNAAIIMVGFTLSYSHAYENNQKSKNSAHYHTDVEILKYLVERKYKIYTTSEILNKTVGVPLWEFHNK